MSNKLNSGPEKPISEAEMHRTLKPNKCWNYIFQTTLPSSVSIEGVVKEFKMAMSAFPNIPVALTTYKNDDRLFNLTSSEISSKNVIPVPFMFGTEPNTFDIVFIKENTPKSIAITQPDRLSMLQKKLLTDGVLNDGSELAGAILLIHKENTFISPKKINLIALGVVDSETNKPLGFVICPENMFVYEFTDGDDGPKRKRKVKEPVSMFAKQTSLVGVQL